MDYTYLFQDCGSVKAKIGVVGATRGYGYTLLAQVLKVPQIFLRVVCSRHTDECIEVLTEIGYDPESMIVCEDIEQIQKAPENATLIVADYRLVPECGITSLVECTGNTAVSCDAATMALTKGINVYMVSKETDSVCGPAMHQFAKEHGAVYTLVNGDQPRNLLDLYSWAKLLGLEVIAAGKSSEYDFVWNSETGEMSYTDGNGVIGAMPQMKECWRYKGVETLRQRQELLDDYTDVICADLCEMNLVSNISGLVPAKPELSYPIAKVCELADIFVPEEDGGILKKTGVVDVFFNLREEGEASFAGGEFVVVRCENDKMWETLRGKGHVLSKNGKYACIYYPYHLMGLETPVSILLGDLKGIGAHPECRQVSVLSCVATEDLPKGTKLTVHGHNHKIDGVAPKLLERAEVGEAAPYYLLSGTTLVRDVKKGDFITMDDADLSKLPIYKLYLQGLEL